MNHQSKIVDPFLQKVLEQHRGQSEFSDILRSIQEEQNDIVDFDFDKNIIVQGCAGSGKTMILFHRLANVLYNLDSIITSIKPNQIVVIIPNDEFRKYLENLTWSLGVDKIKMMTIDEYLLSKIEDILLRIFKGEDAEHISQNSSRRAVTDLDEFILATRKNLEQELTINSSAAKFGKKTINDLSDFIESYQSTIRKMIRNRIEESERRKETLRPSERSSYVRWREKSKEEIRKYRHDAIIAFRDKFLSGKCNRDYMLGLISAVCENAEISEYRPTSDRMLMVDEGQDYGKAEYESLKKINPDCIFNIFGDTDQKVFDRGIEEWSEIKELFQAHYFTLNQDYRNSNQIVSYVNETLNKDMVAIGFDTKEVEEIELKKLPVYLQYERNILKHKVAIVTDRQNFYAKVPKDVAVLPVQKIKGLEFDAVFISPEIQSLSTNFRYVALTRALSDLYILK